MVLKLILISIIDQETDAPFYSKDNFEWTWQILQYLKQILIV